MAIVVAAKSMEWKASERFWEEGRYGFYITYDTDDMLYYAHWGEGDEDSFETLDEAQKWCQDKADEWVRVNVTVTHNNQGKGLATTDSKQGDER